jgi:catechol 2,3-dioxygenase-like lactoylglutathione lyase family enzyme
MTLALNHLAVLCRDKEVSAKFLTDLLGLPPARPYGNFLVVDLDNGVSMDYASMGADADIAWQHYAFLVSEEQFDQIFGRLQASGQEYWAFPGHNYPGRIVRRDNGRGMYFDDPDGHRLEVITQPYGPSLVGLPEADLLNLLDPPVTTLDETTVS